MEEQWQTIEEFKANPVDGLCFVVYCNCVVHCNYEDKMFVHDSVYNYSIRDITHVMPIKTPEAPKC